MSRRTLIFDFDGVIADTQNLHVAAWERTFAAMGWDIEPTICDRAAEEDDRDFLTSILREKEIDEGDAAGWIARKQALVETMLGNHPRIYPGVAAVLATLADTHDLAIATTTWRRNVEIVAQAGGFRPRLRTIVGKEDLGDREVRELPYAVALRKLAIRPAEVIIVAASSQNLEVAQQLGCAALQVGGQQAGRGWAHDEAYLQTLQEFNEAKRRV